MPWPLRRQRPLAMQPSCWLRETPRASAERHRDCLRPRGPLWACSFLRPPRSRDYRLEIRLESAKAILDRLELEARPSVLDWSHVLVRLFENCSAGSHTSSLAECTQDANRSQDR